MKSLVASIILLSSVVVLTICGSICVSVRLENVRDSIESISIDKEDFASVMKSLSLMEEKYQKNRILFSLILNDDTSDTIENYIDDIKSAAEAESKDDLLVAKNRLIAHIEQTRRLNTFNIDSIF